MRFEAKLEDAPLSIDFLAYFCEVQIGDYHVASITRRDVMQQHDQGDRRFFDFGAAINLGNYVLQSRMGDTKKIISDVYENTLRPLGKTASVLDVGDMRACADRQARDLAAERRS